jgi:SAM-dependent methyltransferase
MHSFRNSISKRLYTFKLKSKKCAVLWGKEYWETENDVHIISCKNCPKFDSNYLKCLIPFGSPVRKCSTAAQEANLHSLDKKDLLEIGFGKHSIPRHLVESVGGTWTGIEPMMPQSAKAAFGRGGYGQVADIPFPDSTFDKVIGIQSLEHWEEPLPNTDLESSYAIGLKEVHRVLKPAGSIYFDAPIHLHGHEMFIAGDVERIRKIFDRTLWQNITIEKWREQYEPLERYPVPAGDVMSWEKSVNHYSKNLLQDIKDNRSVCLITIKARKR